MKKPGSIALLYMLAALLAAGSLWLTAASVAGLPRRLAQLARRQGDLVQLQGLAERHAVQRATVQAVEAAGARPADLAPLLQEWAPGLAVEIHERESAPLLPGWSARRVDLRMGQVEAAAAAGIAARLEALRPPWRVVELQVAGGGAPGQGRMNLVLENLAHSGKRAAP